MRVSESGPGQQPCGCRSCSLGPSQAASGTQPKGKGIGVGIGCRAEQIITEYTGGDGRVSDCVQ